MLHGGSSGPEALVCLVLWDRQIGGFGVFFAYSVHFRLATIPPRL